MLYHTSRLYRFLGSKSIFKSYIILSSTTAVKMASCRKRLQSEYEIERMLEDSASEGDNVFSEDENSFRSESESQSESEECATDSDETAPPASKRTKEEGWKWIVTGDRPSKFHFTGNAGVKPATIRNLLPEPNPLEVFQLMVHDSLWDEIATETNRFAVQFYDKNPNKSMVPFNFP